MPLTLVPIALLVACIDCLAEIEQWQATAADIYHNNGPGGPLLSLLLGRQWSSGIRQRLVDLLVVRTRQSMRLSLLISNVSWWQSPAVTSDYHRWLMPSSSGMHLFMRTETLT